MYLKIKSAKGESPLLSKPGFNNLPFVLKIIKMKVTND